jgi:predicted permease
MLALIRAFFSRLARLVRRNRAQASIDEELQCHLEMEIAENLRQGLSPEEARRRALVALGGLQQTKEEYREAWALRWLGNLAQDLRFAFRTYRKNPGFVAVVVLTLMIGIGINVGFFTAFSAYFLAPVPVHDPDRLAMIYLVGTRNGKVAGNLSYPEYLAVRDGDLSLEGLAAYQDVSVDASFGRARGVLVSDNYFSVLGGDMARGRAFAREEVQTPGANPVVVLSHKTWRQRFEGDPQIVGKTIRLNGVSFTIIGVAESGFGGIRLDVPDFWAPIVMHAVLLPGSTLDEGEYGLQPTLVARLPRGVSLEQVRTRLLSVTRNVLPPGRTIASRFSLETLGSKGRLRELARSDFFLRLLTIAVAFALVLLIACANVASLLLARAGARRREIAVRLGLGASRARLVQQLLTENGLLALASGLLSVLFAQKTATAILSLIPYANFDVQLDLNIVFFTLMVSLGAAFFSGFTPAMESTRADLVSAMRGEAVSLFGRLNSARLRNRLVVVQITVCLVLLTGTGLLLPSALRASLGDQGFNSDNVFLLSVQRGPYGRDNPSARALLAERLRHLPSVKNIAMIPERLLGPEWLWSAAIGGLNAQYRYVTSQYFPAMRIPIVRGRSFTEDEVLNEAPVAVISQTAAAALFPGREPIGKMIPVRASVPPAKAGSKEAMWRPVGTGSSVIIGVARDVAYSRSVLKPNLTCVYLPTRPDHPGNTTILIRIEGNSGAVMQSIRAESAAALGSEAVLRVAALADEVRRNSSAVTFLAKVTTSLGAIALLLTVVGLYSMMSYVVSQRTQEIGIRMAMGAQARDVVWLILGRALKLTIIGTVAGLALAAGVYQVLGTMVFKVNLLDPTVFAAVSAVLAAVCLAAAYVPARRATRLDPLVALRHE